MKIAIPTEILFNETRVGATPETVKKLIALGYQVSVQSGAGAKAFLSDQDYAEKGATITANAAETYENADIVLKIRYLAETEIDLLKSGACVFASMDPYEATERLQAYADKNINCFAMEWMPRITRAQSMDILSSQSNLAGYKAVIDAAGLYGQAMPMMMTAAGTIAPARVVVMGAGVAGLQAIATARRLGAIVSAFDVRPAAKEQVESLGASFIEVDPEASKDAETSGGYAKEMDDAYKQKQADVIHQTLKKQDIVITTALIPGKPAPKLITDAMLQDMKAGSIIIDLAAERGGNVEGTEVDQIVEKHGVRIVGPGNMAGQLPADASALFSRNLYNLIALFTDSETQALSLDWEDEILTGITLTRDGKIVHPNLA